MNDKNSRKIPELLLERWRLGELSDERKQKLVLEFGEEAIQKELAVLEIVEAEFVDKLPPRQKPTLSIAGSTPKPKNKFITYAAPLLVAALALFVIFRPQQSSDDILLKGGQPPLLVYKQTEMEPILLKDGDKVQGGDLIQIVYNAENFEYGLILSIDSQGAVTYHWPDYASQAVPYEKNRKVTLKDSFRLDTNPGFERIFFFRTNKTGLNINPDLAKKGLDLSKTSKLNLDSEIDQYSIILWK